MKTTATFIISIAFILNSFAQDRISTAARQLSEAFVSTLENATEIQNSYSNKPCAAKANLKGVNTSKFMPRIDRIEKDIFYLDYHTGNLITYHTNNLNTEMDLDLGLYNSLLDKALAAISSSNSFTEFVSKYTGLNLADVNKEDLKRLRFFYNFNPFTNSATYYIQDTQYYKEGNCIYVSTLKFKPTGINFPNVTYELNIRSRKTCECKNGDESIPAKTVFVYKAQVEGTYSSQVYTFGPAKNPTYEILDLECCPGKTTEDENPVTEVSLNENISLPDQFVGVNVGAGFSQDFEESSYCLGGEYLYILTEVGNSNLFIGANAGFDTTSFMDFNSTTFSIGPTVQLFSPITPSGETHMTNGISGNFIFGSNENSGFKDDVSGFSITLNTGVNVPINDNTSVGIIIPVVSHKNLTFTSEGGFNEVKRDDTTLFINKNNPVKISARFGF